MRRLMLRLVAFCLGLVVDLLAGSLERVRRQADRAEVAFLLADIERKLRARL